MVSKVALARKKQREQMLTEAGNFRKINRAKKNREWRIYFDENGDIITFTQDENLVPKDDWLTYDFTQDQLSILIEKNVSQYQVTKSKDVDNLYSIEVKKEKPYVLNATTAFLSEIPESYSDDEEYEVLCTLTNTEFIIALNSQTRAKYIDIEPEVATINSAKKLLFFITAPKDPHILIQKIEVTLEELLSNNNPVIKPINIRANDYCSLYTKYKFKNYRLMRK